MGCGASNKKAPGHENAGNDDNLQGVGPNETNKLQGDISHSPTVSVSIVIEPNTPGKQPEDNTTRKLTPGDYTGDTMLSPDKVRNGVAANKPISKQRTVTVATGDSKQKQRALPELSFQKPAALKEDWKVNEQVPRAYPAEEKHPAFEVKAPARLEADLEEEENLLTMNEFYNLMNGVGREHEALITESSYLLVIDARMPDEYAKGHVATAVNVPMFTGGWRSMLSVLRSALGGIDDDDFDEFPDYVVVYDGKGMANDVMEVPAASPAAKAVSVLKQMEEDMTIPSQVSYLRGGYALLEELYPFLTTSKAVNREELSAFPTELLPCSLYLGDWTQASEYEVLKTVGITALVNCAPEAPQTFTNDNSAISSIMAPSNVRDNNECSFKAFFKPACDFIDEKIAAGERVLIHCAFGVSRSPAIAIAYLIRKNKIPLSQAMEQVRSCRNIIGPALKFLEELGEWEEEHCGELTSNPEELETLKIEVDELKFPQQIPNFTVQNVFLGSHKNSLVKAMLHVQKINVIVNVAKEAPCVFENDPQFTYMHFPLNDRGDLTFKKSLPNIVKQLAYTAALPGVQILLHCNADREGKTSRSQTVMTAFIMYQEKITLQAAHEKLKALTPHTGREKFQYRSLYSSALLKLEESIFGAVKSDTVNLAASDPPVKKSNRRKTHRPTIVGKLSKVRR